MHDLGYIKKIPCTLSSKTKSKVWKKYDVDVKKYLEYLPTGKPKQKYLPINMFNLISPRIIKFNWSSF